MIKLVNGIPEKLIEMDESVTFVEQMNEDASPVTQINKFNVNPEEVDEFLKCIILLILNNALVIESKIR